MKWIVVGLGALALLAGGVAAIGAALPRNHRASRTLRVKRPPADVWAAVNAATSASSVPVDVIESLPPHHLVTRVKETETMFGGTWTIDITPEPTGSSVTITEDGWVANPIFRFMAKYVVGHHATMDAILKNVATRLNEEAALTGE